MTFAAPWVPGHNSGIKRQLDQRLHNHLESTCTQ